MANTTKMIATKFGKEMGLLHDLDTSTRMKLQKVLLEMLKDLQCACSEMGIEVCVMGGSALGAVRHKGFIPWDDDLDVAMTRHDWNIFVHGFKDSKLAEKYDLDACDYNNIDPKYVLNKLCLKDSELVLIEDIGYQNHNNIYIDLFIIDKVSDNAIIRTVDTFMSDNIRFIGNSVSAYKFRNDFMMKVMRHSLKTRLFYDLRLIQGIICSFISHRKWCLWFHRYISRHENENTGLTTVAMGLKRYKKETLAREVWFPYSTGTFEGLIVNLPHDVHRYLSEIYGDYMTPPPENARETHSVVRLRLPDGINL